MVYKAKPTDKQYSRLLEDADTKVWYDGLGKENTKETYLRQLYYYLRDQKLSSSDLIAEFQTNYDLAIKRLRNHINKLKADNTPPKAIALRFAAVKSRLLLSRVRIDNKMEGIKFGNTNLTPTIEDEQHLTAEQFKKLLEVSPLKAKAMECLEGLAGIRPGAAVDLQLKDFAEITIENRKVILPLEKQPTFVKIRAELSKHGLPYMSLLASKGCEILVEYLQYRLNNGEVLTPTSKVIAGFQSGTKKYRRNAFSGLISHYIKKLVDMGVLERKQRPYILRAYFDMALLNSDLKQEYQSFLMGHKGTIEQVYTLRKQLAEEMKEELRRQFRERVETWLWPDTASNKVTKHELEDSMVEMWEFQARALGQEPSAIITNYSQLDNAGKIAMLRGMISTALNGKGTALRVEQGGEQGTVYVFAPKDDKDQGKSKRQDVLPQTEAMQLIKEGKARYIATVNEHLVVEYV